MVIIAITRNRCELHYVVYELFQAGANGGIVVQIE
jgi:hypothetical protein